MLSLNYKNSTQFFKRLQKTSIFSVTTKNGRLNRFKSLKNSLNDSLNDSLILSIDKKTSFLNYKMISLLNRLQKIVFYGALESRYQSFMDSCHRVSFLFLNAAIYFLCGYLLFFCFCSFF